MNRILSDYFEICSKFRANGLSKSERQQRHALLSQWEKTDFESGRLSLGEIKDFWNNHNDICWNRMFINKVICPAIAADLETGGYESVKFLFHCFRGHESSCIHSDSPLAFFVITAEVIINRFSWLIYCSIMNRIMLMHSDTSMILSNIFLSSPYMKCLRVC